MTMTEYYASHRSPQGTAKMKAWYRARQRALSCLSQKYSAEFGRLFAAAVEARPYARRAARETALRELSRKHPRKFRQFLNAELEDEPDYQVQLRRGPRPRGQ